MDGMRTVLQVKKNAGDKGVKANGGESGEVELWGGWLVVGLLEEKRGGRRKRRRGERRKRCE
jgi:hypothetical protein